MAQSIGAVAWIKGGPAVFNRFSDMLDQAPDIQSLELTLPASQYNSSDAQKFFNANLSSLANIKLLVKFERQNTGEIVFSLDRKFPALTHLSLDGAALQCRTLGNLQTLELRNYPFQPPRLTANQFLELLKTGTKLRQLTLSNYAGIAHQDLSVAPLDRLLQLPQLEQLTIQDTQHKTAQQLSYWHILPRTVAISGTYAPGPITSANLWLELLPKEYPMLYAYHIGQTTKATLRSLGNGTIQLLMEGHHTTFSLEVHSDALVNPAFAAQHYNMAAASAGAVLASAPGLVTLKCTGMWELVDHTGWFTMLATVPMIRQLVIHGQAGQAESDAMTRRLLRSIAFSSSPPPQEFVPCPHLKKIILRQTRYPLTLLEIVCGALQWRSQRSCRLESLELQCAVAGAISMRTQNERAEWQRRLKAANCADSIRFVDGA